MKVSTFYLIGAICFSVVALTSIYSYIVDFETLKTANKIGLAFNHFFYLVLAYFFYIEYKKTNYNLADFEDNSKDVLKELETVR